MNVCVILSKIPGMAKWLDKQLRTWAEMRMAQEELGKAKAEKETLERMLIKEMLEKHKYREELELAKQINMEAIKGLMKWCSDATWGFIDNKYYLIPKVPPRSSSPLASALAARLGQINKQ